MPIFQFVLFIVGFIFISNEPCCGSSLLSSACKMSLRRELKLVTWGASSQALSGVSLRIL